MKLLIAMLAVAGLVLGSSAYAGGDEAAAAPAAEKAIDTGKAAEAAPAAKVKPVAKPAMEPITFAGKVIKEEKTFKGKDGAEIKKAIYKVVAADGAAVYLPPVKKAKEGETALDYDTFVDKNVKVSGEGFSKEKDGKKKVIFVKVTAIENAPAQ